MAHHKQAVKKTEDPRVSVTVDLSDLGAAAVDALAKSSKQVTTIHVGETSFVIGLSRPAPLIGTTEGNEKPYPECDEGDRGGYDAWLG